MNIGTMIKRLQDIMRQDAGVNGDAQRIEQIVWMLFLKLYDSKESEWEILEDNYKSIIPEEYRWRNWAPDNKDGKAITGDEMGSFIIQLFATLKDLEVDEKICLITERHIGAGITADEAKALGLPDRNYIPETIEEKIVAHSDNLVHGVTKVDLDFVIEKWNNKNMKQESIDMLIKLHEELLGD